MMEKNKDFKNYAKNHYHSEDNQEKQKLLLKNGKKDCINIPNIDREVVLETKKRRTQKIDRIVIEIFSKTEKKKN